MKKKLAVVVVGVLIIGIGIIYSLTPKVGDSIFMGVHGDEDVEWIILEVKLDKMLVISKYEQSAYGTFKVPADKVREMSKVTQNLNSRMQKVRGELEERINFTEEEQDRIIVVDRRSSIVEKRQNKYKSVDLSDEITITEEVGMFLLNYEEIKKYFPKEEQRKTAYYDKPNAVGYDWLIESGRLRSEGENGPYYIELMVIDSETGEVQAPESFYYSGAERCSFGVRPAMWISR